MTKKKAPQKFYAAAMFYEKGVSWSAENFTEDELAIVQRFLDEVKEHTAEITVECISIVDGESEGESLCHTVD